MSNVLFDWRIRDIEIKADRATSRLYELDSLRSDVDRLQLANRELGSEVAGLRAELQAAQDAIQALREVIAQQETR
jgi:predicted  nucleic acid-binding Zn-ribbon protein